MAMSHCPLNTLDKKDFAGIEQEREKEFPELVTTDASGYKAIAYDRFTAVLLEAIKTQQEEIKGLKKELASLKRKL